MSGWYLVQAMRCTISEISDVVLSDIKYKVNNVLGKKFCLCWVLQPPSFTVDICDLMLSPYEELGSWIRDKAGRSCRLSPLTCSLIVPGSVQSKQHKSTTPRPLEMEIEDTLTLSGEERISQRKPEDDIIRRYIGSFTFPNISYLFGLQNAKVRQINKQKSWS